MAGKTASKFARLKKKAGKPAGISGKVINLLEIYTRIAQNRFPSVDELTRLCETSKRTIYRYIEIINMIDPIEFDKERNGYKFVNGDRIKKVFLTDDELLMLLITGETATNLGGNFKKSFQDFVAGIANTRKLPSDRLPLVIKAPGAINTELFDDYFKTISNCIADSRSIDIVYTSLYRNETTERRVDPYGVFFYEGAWHVIGYCNLKKGLRTFALDKIESLKETDHYFVKDTGFDLKKNLSGSWGIIFNEDAVDITVRFSKDVASYIDRQKKWHPTEIRKKLPDGSIELSLRVTGVSEIKGWIYSWLPEVEVIKPGWLRAEIKKELLKAAEKL